jgi:GTPase
MIDLCGHEHFLKTTVYGLMGMAPDLVMLLVGANAGVQKMTREHLGLTAALQLPVVVVVTKIDMAPKHILEESMKRVDRVLRLASRKKFTVNDIDDARAAAAAMTSGNVAPVFQISCITGEGLDLLRTFYSEMACGAGQSLAGSGVRASTSVGGKEAQTLEQAEKFLREDNLEAIECEFHIDNVYNVPGVGTVVSGSVFHGVVTIGMHLTLGPDDLGDFREVRVGSIHRQCVPVDCVFAGQQSTFAIKATNTKVHHSNKEALKRQHIRKGMVLLSQKRAEALKANHPTGSLAITTFEADVKVLHHTTTIQIGYAPIVHLGTIRQSAYIEKISFPKAATDSENLDGSEKVDNTPSADQSSQNFLRTGSSALVQFRFAYRPEFVTPGRPLVFREGTTKGVGRVVRLL